MAEKNQAGLQASVHGGVVAGIDVGSTFTDLILIDAREGGGVRVARYRRRPTTRLSAWLTRLAG